jgi:hypothetical protein
MRYPWFEIRQSIQHDVLHHMEGGACQGIHVVRRSAVTSRPLTSAQVRRAMQALQSQGLISHTGSRWQFADAAMREAQANAWRAGLGVGAASTQRAAAQEGE